MRVSVEVSDVGAVLRATQKRFDAILYDVDNGPQALTRKANQALYGEPGVTMAKRCLRPGGVFAVWAAEGDRNFERLLRKVGFDVELHDVPARGDSGPKHVIFLGRV